MEFEQFENIRHSLCASDRHISEGKMMSSPAIHYKNNVFAFFSRKNKMVFKLGKGYPTDKIDFEIEEFSPFKNKRPLTGWYEVDYVFYKKWKALALEALHLIREEKSRH